MTFIDPIKEAKAVAALRESLAAVDADDETLLLDTVEGETQFFEIVDAVLERMAVSEAGIAGIESIVAKLGARQIRYEERLKTDRALIEQALTIADLKKLERPSATLSITNRSPSLQVTEESDIPAVFWKPGKPTLDKKALTEALKERARVFAAERLPEVELPPEIPGACLTNGAPTLTIRRA